MAKEVTALASWYGSNRMLAENVGRLLKGCEWVGVPFAGGMCELKHIAARTMLVGDLHRHVINLAAVARDHRETLQGRLESLPFHPDVLAEAQEVCRRWEDDQPVAPRFAWSNSPAGDVDRAAAYFVCVWMARNGTAGTKTEFNTSLSVRWDAGGGDSVVRFRSAIKALAEWEAVLRRCTFVCLDVFDFLDMVKDEPKHGVYLDPPFPGPGDKYKHKFGTTQHHQLAARLSGFLRCRIVCRFYDVPLVRSLYPEREWAWHLLDGRTQTNAKAPEVLLVNRRGEQA